MSTRIYKEWLSYVTLGEFLGFLIPSVIGGVSVALALPQLLQAVVMVAAGLGEGAVLGYFQARVLHKYIKNMSRTEWITATTIGAGLAWMIGMLPSTIGESLATISLWILIPAAVALGSILLLTIGVAQYIVLRKYRAQAHGWIWINVLAWLVGLGVVFAFIFMAPDGVLPAIIFSVLGGLGMAFSMAAVTGPLCSAYHAE